MIDPREQFERTKCSCELCRVGCESMPGFLIFQDAERIYYHQTGLDPADNVLAFWSWARANLRGGGGAVILQDGEMKRVPTMTPKQDEFGRCVFLSSTGQCKVHDVAPFGCAYCDMHMSAKDGNDRAVAGIRACMKPTYQIQVNALIEDGQESPPTEDRRREFSKLCHEIERKQMKESCSDA